MQLRKVLALQSLQRAKRAELHTIHDAAAAAVVAEQTNYSPSAKINSCFVCILRIYLLFPMLETLHMAWMLCLH